MRYPIVKTLLVFPALFVLFAMSSSVRAESDKVEGILDAELVEKTAVVRAINKADRTVVLQTPDGEIKQVDVDERVKNFDQIELGDKVTADYYDAVVLYISSGKDKPGVDQKSFVNIAGKGDKPGVNMVETITVTAKVEDIDYDERVITIMGPEGNSMKLRVNESAKEYGQVKVGDEVVVIMTEAVAVSVEKP
jgi:hypothetical protein